MSHTKTPWKIQAHHMGFGNVVIKNCDGKQIAMAIPQDGGDEIALDIVRYVNAHESLVDALGRAYQIVKAYQVEHPEMSALQDIIDECWKAYDLALAEGKE